MTSVPGVRRGREAVSRLLSIAVVLTLAGCVERPRPAVSLTPLGPKPTANAVSAGVRPGPPIAALLPAGADAGPALTAFRASCPSLLRRADTSGLTRNSDWQGACAAAADTPVGGGAAFFARYFETAVVGDGSAFATGYYEPQIRGSRIAAPGYAVPVYRNPGDIVAVDLGAFSADLAGRKVRGRVADGKLVPYHERREIEAGALAGRGLELAYAADPIELFFLQVQGSGRLALPDGSVMRIGYDGQNGREYVGIGKLLRDRGQIGPGQATMQGIIAWLRAHPDEGRAVMDENKSYVFFKELTGDAPLGALGLPVTPHVSLAADPGFAPLGVPVFLNLDRPEASGLWVAQDTGGAIKGANRFDTFWGAGDDAARIAGGMAAHGAAYLLLPIGTLDRLRNAGAPARP